LSLGGSTFLLQERKGKGRHREERENLDYSKRKKVLNIQQTKPLRSAAADPYGRGKKEKMHTDSREKRIVGLSSKGGGLTGAEEIPKERGRREDELF